ncbi:unnamed protein product [Clavelina lepadiformis]|uniref:Uncharacterized protein n=1 Tax=Clavelina lepadiformis TaxID=159417 RepID=A0ABP0EW00_CLALP
MHIAHKVFEASASQHRFMRKVLLLSTVAPARIDVMPHRPTIMLRFIIAAVWMTLESLVVSYALYKVIAAFKELSGLQTVGEGLWFLTYLASRIPSDITCHYTASLKESRMRAQENHPGG